MDNLLFSAGIDTENFKKQADDLRKEILGVGDVAKDVKIDFGLTKENIMIQKQVIAEIEQQIKEITNRAESMAPGKAQANVYKELGPLKVELEQEQKALIALQEEIKGTQEKYSSLVTQKNKALDIMRRLTLENQQGTEEYKNAEKAVIEYTEAIKESDARARMLAAGGFASLIQGAGLLTGAMATGQSLMGLFGSENENLNRIMLKTQALLSATITLQQLQTSVTTSGIFGITSLATAKNAWAAANARVAAALGISTAAARAFLITISGGLLVVIPALIAVWDKLARKQREAAELNKLVADSVAGPLGAYKSLQAQYNALGEDLNAKKKFIVDNAEAFKDLGVEVKTTSDTEKLFVSGSEAFIQSLMARAKAAAYMETAMLQYKKAIENQMEVEDFQNRWNDANLLGKVPLTAEAIFTNVDSRKTAQFNAKGDDLSRKAAEQQLIEAQKFAESGMKKIVEATKKARQTPAQVAEIILPRGSVAEIRKRLQDIDSALTMATNIKAIDDLKSKRIKTAEELAEAEKRITIKSLQDRAAEQETYFNAIKVLSTIIGEEAAQKMYEPLMEGSQSYVNWLTMETEKLREKQDLGVLSEKERADLVFLTEKYNELTNQKSPLEKFTTDLDEALAKIPTYAGQLEYLDKLYDQVFSEGGNNSIDKLGVIGTKNDEIIANQKALYSQFLKEMETFEQKKQNIAAKYSAIDDQIINDPSKTTGEKNDLLTKSAKAKSREFSKAFLDEFKNSETWSRAFGDLEFESNKALAKILEGLNAAKANAADMDPADLREIEEAINRVKSAMRNNPFSGLIKGLKAYKNAADDIAKADALEDIFNSLNEGQRIFNAAGDAVLTLGNAFGEMSPAATDAVNNIMAIGNAAFDLGKSISTGDIAGMISAGAQLIASIGTALSGDQKRERNIQKWAEAVSLLKDKYDELARSLDKALGEDQFSDQRKMVENLRKQKEILAKMYQEEDKKKKTDKAKLEEIKKEMANIDTQIQDIFSGMVEQVTQTDARGLADQLADALVEAYSKGEDAALAYGRVADDVMKNAVKNALKMQLLEKPMQNIISQMLANMGFNDKGEGTFDGLDAKEREALKQEMGRVSKNYMDALGAYKDLFGEQAEQAQGLKGDIKGITEKTAGALEGQINALRVMKAEALIIHRRGQETAENSLRSLVAIEHNTRPLHKIQKDISELNSKVKNNLAGI